MIGAVAGHPAATYSIGFEAEGYDEMEFARIAARRFGTEHHEYYVTPDDLVASIPTWRRTTTSPSAIQSVLPAYYCAKMARDDGVTQAAGRRWRRRTLRRQFALRQAAHLRLVRRGAGAWLRSGVLRAAAEAARSVQLPLAEARAAAMSSRHACRCPTACRCTTCCCAWARRGLHAGLPGAGRPQDPLRQQRGVWSRATGQPLNRMLAYDWRYTLAEADLPKVRGHHALAGVDVGFPFLDAGLLDFSLKLPTEYKLKGLKLRWFFKEALRGFLPDEIITKKKQGFGLPFGVWANQHDRRCGAGHRFAEQPGRARRRPPGLHPRCWSPTCPPTRATTARWCGS
jgi:asparagine synthase (glutamine-hydrolysing)